MLSILPKHIASEVLTDIRQAVQLQFQVNRTNQLASPTNGQPFKYVHYYQFNVQFIIRYYFIIRSIHYVQFIINHFN